MPSDMPDLPKNFANQRVAAILGPTNTGKTHYAMERMLAYESGMIGFPLRLLARENYQRAVAKKGVKAVALITGEEKIVPPGARYFMCTVEAMPVTLALEFLAIDEIQMCSDAERGHIFTDRLLHARGSVETLFLGADTVAGVLKKLVPGITFETRPRLSQLKYSGPQKIANLPKRSAIVAFSATDVYALAETVRRYSGGAAVVLGALSPKTRNAQVEMYQQGDVDYLVATDAIGMGLNMDVDHVAFSALGKFDGRRHRALNAAEIAQIAGRAGRHMNDGSFGPTGALAPFDADIVARIENHEFPPLTGLSWRNPELDLASVGALKKTLGRRPPRPGLVPARGMDDERILDCLMANENVALRATGYDSVSLLWDLCRVPDFRKIGHDAHARFLSGIYDDLTGKNAVIDENRVAREMDGLDRTDGDIEHISGRISGIRVWAYMAFQSGWLQDPVHWQQRARIVEDRLSDALHERLTQRFVDRKTAMLVRHLKSAGTLRASVDSQHRVVVAGETVGRIEGFRFINMLQAGHRGRANAEKSIRQATEKALATEMANRVRACEQSQQDRFSLAVDDSGFSGEILWDGFAVAALVKGGHVLTPDMTVRHDDLLTDAMMKRVKKRLGIWLGGFIETRLQRLFQVRDIKPTSGAMRAICFQLCENTGTIRRRDISPYITALGKKERQSLARTGVVIGRECVYMPDMLKPQAMEVRALLWGLFKDRRISPPPPSRVSVPITTTRPADFLPALGFMVFSGIAVRMDMVERILDRIWAGPGKDGFVISTELLSLAGCGFDDMAGILKGLGYRIQSGSGDKAVYGRHPVKTRRGQRKPGKKPSMSTAPLSPASPFAALENHVHIRTKTVKR